jgi:hypothetical protein
MTTAITAKLQTIITEEYAVEIDTTGRGAYAKIKDAGSPFNGLSAYASVPQTALALLKDKVEEARRTPQSH